MYVFQKLYFYPTEGPLMLNKAQSASHSLALLALDRVAANLLNPLTQRPPVPGRAVQCQYCITPGKAETIYILLLVLHNR